MSGISNLFKEKTTVPLTLFNCIKFLLVESKATPDKFCHVVGNVAVCATFPLPSIMNVFSIFFVPKILIPEKTRLPVCVILLKVLLLKSKTTAPVVTMLSTIVSGCLNAN